MILQNGTVVAVMDGHRIRMFRNKGPETRIELVELPAPAVEPVNAGSGGRHRNLGANQDPDRVEEDNFAAAAGDLLNCQLRDGRIEKLFLIADPRTLGEVRRHLTAKTGELVGSLAKDLVGSDIATIEAAIARA